MSEHQSSTDKGDPDDLEQGKAAADPCPVHTSLSEFMREVAEGDIRGAAAVLRSADTVWSEELWPVRIGHLVRYVADWQQSHSEKLPEGKPWRPQRIAIVGSGTAGLVCAGSLARMGYPVTIYEGIETPGGVLRHSIADSVLAKKILDWELEILTRLGVEICCNTVVGEELRLEDLTGRLKFSAVFVATGAGLAHSVGKGHSLNPLSVESSSGQGGERSRAIIVEEGKCLVKDEQVDAVKHALAATASVVQSAGAGKNGAATIHKELTEEDWAEEEIDKEWDDFMEWCLQEEHNAHE